MKIVIVAASLSRAQHWVEELRKSGRGVQSATLIFLTNAARAERLRGHRFQEGDVVHYLDGYGLIDDVRAAEEAIDHAALTWMPQKEYYSAHGLIREVEGHVRVPNLSNPDRVRDWLDA